MKIQQNSNMQTILHITAKNYQNSSM